MKFIIYFLITGVINIILPVIFRNSIIISELSLAPSILLVIAIIESGYFTYNREKTDFNTNYSSGSFDFTKEEWKVFVTYTRNGFLLSVPLYIPFILFFSWLKLISILIFFLSFISGSTVFRLRYGKQLKYRMQREKAELERQRAKEASGYWK